jgi:subtilisin-like proprotein convertase family protein
MPVPNDRLLSQQWHLRATVDGRFDLGVLGAWSPGEGAAYTGAGTRTVVIDDGFDYRHRDLAPNYNAAVDHDFRTGRGDPFGTAQDAHGTAVAGIIGAAANGGGTVGVAYETELVGYRTASLIGDPWLRDVRDAIRAAAASADADVVNISQGIANDPESAFGGRYLAVRFEEIAASIGAAVDTGRDGLGATIVKAAGNSRTESYDVNADPWAHDTRQVVVAAVNQNGYVSAYSSYGAAVLVSGFGTPGQVVTTDRRGDAGYDLSDHVRSFNGTSAATPMVSGVVALMYDAEAALGWRDVQSILAASARHVGSEVGDGPARHERFAWAWNGAETWNGGGLHFSNDYGYGLVDARAAVRLAETWLQTGAAAATSLDEASQAVDVLDAPAVIPDGKPSGTSFAGAAEFDDVVERVTVELTFSTTWAADLQLFVTSPDGTVSQLAGNTGGASAFDGTWTFETQAFRGERAAGTWSVRVVDRLEADVLTVSDIVLRTWGADTADDRYVFTDAYSDRAGQAGHATDIVDDNGGSDTVNAAAVRSASEIRLDGATGSVDGVDVRFAGIEHAIGGDGDDILAGDGGGNRLHGMRGADRLRGGDGDDALHGLTGSDVLAGGLGRDLLYGGAGSDRFRFASVDDSPAGGDGCDVLGAVGGVAFANPGRTRGDLIELWGIDADETAAGDQAFVFDSGEATGSLRCVDVRSATRVLGFTDDDAGADFWLDILDGRTAAASYTAADFGL